MFTSEDADPPWDEENELLDNGHWFIVGVNNVRQGIGFPAVYQDGDIYWRLR